MPRARLLRQLQSTEAPLVLLVAPAGYGKTGLLSGWAERDERPFAWVSFSSGRRAEATVIRLLNAAGGGQVIVADDAHLAPPAVIRRMLDAACALPFGSTLALSSRARPVGPLGRLRAARLLLELTADDLRLNRLEAALLVDSIGIGLDRQQLDRLLERTGGWPAMVSLAAQGLLEAPDVDAAIAAFSGADRAVAEYLEDEALGALSASERAFLRRTSILKRLTGPACDAVMGEPGSGALLVRLARAGLPIEPLDRTDHAFRTNPLLARLLRSELDRLEPECRRALHRRAAAFYRREGEPGTAVAHAMACRDARRAGRIAWAVAPRYAAEGRGAELGAWLAVVREPYADPALALTAATHHLLAGRRRAAMFAADAAERALEVTPLPEGGAAVALLRACAEPASMAAEAERARAQLAPQSHWHALALLVTGVAHHLDGARAPATAELEEAVDRATGHLPMVASLAHAQLALLAAEAEAWDDAADHASDAEATLTSSMPEPVCALVATATALVAAHRGELAQARHAAAEADRLLGSRADFPPWLVAQAHVWLARAAIRLSDGPTARRQLGHAARLAPVVGGELVAWVHDGWARADALAESATGDGPTLTNAELRILRLLPSHLSFREIGERLHISTNTVKTQALAVYRKLEVSCRSEAVARGRSAGLISGA